MVTTGYLEHDTMVGGLKLHYQEWGSPAAPAIVMLHGFGVSGHMFDEFAERMQGDFHLIALDQRGHGDSDWSSDGDYSREAFVSDLEQFRVALGLDRFILVGHSMGGLNSVAYAVEFPGRVRALVLVDVGPESAKEGVDNIVRFTRGPDELEFEEFVELAHRFNQRRTIENIRERMRHRLKPTDSGKYTWKFDRRFRQEDNGLRIGSELSNDETWQLFRRISMPTLLVRGAESDVFTPDVAERAAREMQRARLVVVASAGHSVPGDNPDDFTRAVREFLGDVQRGQFEAAAESEPPPLHQLMEEHDSARRRGLSLTALILAGAGAVLALGGVGYLWKRRKDEQKRRSLRQRAKMMTQKVPPLQASAADLESARKRAAALVAELGAVGRDGVARARNTVHDVDLDRARQAATDVVQALGESTRHAPDAMKTAVSRIDRKKLRKRTSRASKISQSLGQRAMNAVVGDGPHAVGKRAKHRRRRMTLWRS